MNYSPSARTRTFALSACAALVLCGCGSPTTDEQAAAPTTAESAHSTNTTSTRSSAAVASDTTGPATTSSAAGASAAASKQSTSAAHTTTSTNPGEIQDEQPDKAKEPTSSSSPTPEHEQFSPSVEEAYERFHTLAPASLFARFDSCRPNGVPKSAACAGEVGQFQFFASDAKAASTTQLLTELRSSRVVEDDGSRVVGWSTLGTTAIITVVDNKRGLVMQHMMSSEKSDPEDVIDQLELTKQADR